MSRIRIRKEDPDSYKNPTFQKQPKCVVPGRYLLNTSSEYESREVTVLSTRIQRRWVTIGCSGSAVHALPAERPVRPPGQNVQLYSTGKDPVAVAGHYV